MRFENNSDFNHYQKCFSAVLRQPIYNLKPAFNFFKDTEKLRYFDILVKE